MYITDINGKGLEKISRDKGFDAFPCLAPMVKRFFSAAIVIMAVAVIRLFLLPIGWNDELLISDVIPDNFHCATNSILSLHNLSCLFHQLQNEQVFSLYASHVCRQHRDLYADNSIYHHT